MIALVPVRDGALPAGASEAIAECAGRVIVAGSGTGEVELDGLAADVLLVELGAVEPARWTGMLVPVLRRLDDCDIVVLPHSPDGRDLRTRSGAADVPRRPASERDQPRSLGSPNA